MRPDLNMLIKSCNDYVTVEWTLRKFGKVWIVMDMSRIVALYFQSESIDSKRVQLEVSAQYSLDHKEQVKHSKLKELELHQHFITFSRTDPIASRHFSPANPSSEAAANFCLRIHVRLGLEKPLDDQLVAVRGCPMQRCVASGAPGPKPAGRTQRNQGGKSFEKILVPQKSQFWQLWPLKNLHGLKEHCGFEMS